MEDIFSELFHENTREIEFDDFVYDLQETVNQQVDFFTRLTDPDNNEFDDLAADGINRLDMETALALTIQVTQKMEEEIRGKFGVAGFDDDESDQAWKLFLDFVKESCELIF